MKLIALSSLFASVAQAHYAIKELTIDGTKFVERFSLVVFAYQLTFLKIPCTRCQIR
jgi:hypothetical protein